MSALTTTNMSLITSSQSFLFPPVNHIIRSRDIDGRMRLANLHLPILPSMAIKSPLHNHIKQVRVQVEYSGELELMDFIYNSTQHLGFNEIRKHV